MKQSELATFAEVKKHPSKTWLCLSSESEGDSVKTTPQKAFSKGWSAWREGKRKKGKNDKRKGASDSCSGPPMKGPREPTVFGSVRD